MDERSRWRSHLTKLNTGQQRAEIKLLLYAAERRASWRRAQSGHLVISVARYWWSDPFMKWAFGLMGMAIALAVFGMPVAPHIAGQLGPLFGAAAYVVLMVLPGVLGGASVRFGWESVRYQLSRWDH